MLTGAARMRSKLRVARGRWRRATSSSPGAPPRVERRAGAGRTTRGETPAEMITRSDLGKLPDAALAMVSACNAAAVGFDLCARRTDDETIAVAARSAAACVRALAGATVSAARGLGIDARPRVRTCDRLRWEWLASTAMVVDGSADGRLLAECARILAEADASAAVAFGEEIAARLRLASAEAYSLASAVAQHRRGLALAFALT